MIGEKLIEQKPVSLVEVKRLLESRKKERELNYEQDIALKYARKFAHVSPKEAEKVVEKLSEIDSLSPQLIVKIVDLLPTKKEVLELLVPKGSAIPEEDLAKVLDITRKYGKA
jgi:DNA-directed RNA polymerase subunit F